MPIAALSSAAPVASRSAHHLPLDIAPRYFRTAITGLFIGHVEDVQFFFNNNFGDNFTLSFTPALGSPGTLQVALAATTPWAEGLGLNSFSGTVTGISAVPEPSSIVLLIPALVGLVLLRKWRPRLPLAQTAPQPNPA
jgi:hypothetical protein